jgi:hypothetical protein
MMNGGPISWESYKQTTVALSLAEGELMALSDAAQEALAHLMFFQTLSIQMPIPILFTDNEAGEAITKRPELNYRQLKHIDIVITFFGITSKKEALMFSTFLAVSKSPISLPNHYLLSNTKNLFRLSA